MIITLNNLGIFKRFSKMNANERLSFYKFRMKSIVNEVEAVIRSASAAGLLVLSNDLTQPPFPAFAPFMSDEQVLANGVGSVFDDNLGMKVGSEKPVNFEVATDLTYGDTGFRMYGDILLGIPTNGSYDDAVPFTDIHLTMNFEFGGIITTVSELALTVPPLILIHTVNNSPKHVTLMLSQGQTADVHYSFVSLATQDIVAGTLCKSLFDNCRQRTNGEGMSYYLPDRTIILAGPIFDPIENGYILGGI